MTENMEFAIDIANKFRKIGINTEVYLNNKKLKSKMKYADKLQIPYVIVVGDDEFETGIVKVKNMNTGEERELDVKSDFQTFKFE